MKDRLKFEPGRNGRGVRLRIERAIGRHPFDVGLSYMDAADALFDLKDFLQASDTGRRCLDDVAARRREEEAARCAI